jgi:hypothetical protein
VHSSFTSLFTCPFIIYSVRYALWNLSFLLDCFITNSTKCQFHPSQEAVNVTVHLCFVFVLFESMEFVSGLRSYLDTYLM